MTRDILNKINLFLRPAGIVIFALVSWEALAADPTPGSACTVSNAHIRSGGPENAGVTYDMTCQGGVWVANLTYAANSNVGVGTSSPVSTLDISTTTGGLLTLSRQATSISSADDIGRIQFWNNDSSLSTQNIYGHIGVRASQNITTDAAASNMYFATTGTTAGGSPTTRMLIGSSGSVGIGTTSPQMMLDVAGTGTTQSAMLMPRDTTANQPAGVEGMLRYDTTTHAMEVYQGASYLGWGSVPAQSAKVDLTGQGAAIAATTMFTPTADGTYEICMYANITVAGTAGTLNLLYQLSTESGASAKQNNIASTNVATLHNIGQSCAIFYTKSGAAVKYRTTFAGVTGSPQYSLHIRVYSLE